MHRLQSADCSKCITLHLKFLHYFVCKNIRLIWYLSRDGTRYPAARPTSLLQMNRRVGTWQVGVRTRSQLWVTNGQTLSRCLIPAAVRVLSRYTQTRTQTDRQTCRHTHLSPLVDGFITARWTLVHSAVLRSHVVCPSVCLSVTLVNCDHIGWNSSKIISPLVSLGCSFFATPTRRVCSKGNTSKFGPKVTHSSIDLNVRDIRSQIAAEWLQIAQRSQWRAYRKPPSLFLTCYRWPPTISPSPKMGVPYAPKIREWPYLCNEWSGSLHIWF